jgi:hypothetical protein
MIELEQAAQGFAAVGTTQQRVGIPAPTLAHHLRFLAAGA